MLIAGSAGCGLRTGPQPLTRFVPAPSNLSLRVQDKQVLVSWSVPPPALISRYGAVEEYELELARLPLGCPECRPEWERSLELRPGGAPLMLEGGSAYYRFDPPPAPATWRARVRTRFRRASSPFSAPRLLEGLSAIPRHSLHAEPLADGGVRLFWEPHRERIIQVLTTGGGQVERALDYRVNVYRRPVSQPWPETPLNGAPLTATQLLLSQTAPDAMGAAGKVEYTLRLVDQFGNEGPAAEPVSAAPKGDLR
jgi:hypothetical protein